MTCAQAIELLPDYFADQLEASERKLVEGHLGTCVACQEEGRQLGQTFYSLAHSVSPIAPSPKVWQAIQTQLLAPVVPPPTPAPRAPIWRVFAVFGVIMLGWVGYLFYMYRSSSNEEVRIERWQTQPQLKQIDLKSYQDEKYGTLMWMPDGRCLFVLLKPPPQGEVYQAWGRKNGELVSLGTFGGRTLEYLCTGQGFERIGVSMEPPGGSAKPTKWMGSVPFW